MSKDNNKKPSLAKRIAREFHNVAFFTSKRGIAIVVLISQLGFPLTGMLFPKAADYAERQGWDPALIEELGAEHARVMGPGSAGILQRLTTIPHASFIASASILGGLKQIFGLNAFATHGVPYSLHQVFNLCHVHLPSERYLEPARLAWTFSGRTLPRETIRDDLPQSPQEAAFILAVHEFQHCNAENQTLRKPLKEADSDTVSIRRGIEKYDNPALKELWIYLRALNYRGLSHDTSLILYSVLNDKPAPDPQAVRDAHEEIKALERTYRGETSRIAWYFRTAEERAALFQQMLAEHKDTLSPLAQRRLALYIDAVDYFTKPVTDEPETAPSATFLPVMSAQAAT